MKIDVLKLDDLQREKGYNNKQLTKEAGLSCNAVSVIRNSQKAHHITIMRIARVLGVDPEELIIREK